MPGDRVGPEEDEVLTGVGICPVCSSDDRRPGTSMGLDALTLCFLTMSPLPVPVLVLAITVFVGPRLVLFLLMFLG